MLTTKPWSIGLQLPKKKKKVSFLEKAQICSPLIRIFQVLPPETSQII